MTLHDPLPCDDAPAWADAPAGWDWLAQDADGQWFWYRTRPELGWAGGVWRSNSRNQQRAGLGLPRTDWDQTLRQREDHAQALKL